MIEADPRPTDRDGSQTTDPSEESRTPPPQEPAGLRAQLSATKESVLRLLRAHRDLALAELAQIMDEVKRLAMLAGVALAALVLLGILLPVGLALFLGEWLFGSIGWGLLHGSLFLLGLAMTAAFAAVGVPRAQLVRNLLIAMVIAVVVGVLCALDLPNAAWARLGESAGLGFDSGVRPLVVGVLALAIIGAVLGLILGARVAGGGGAAFGGLVAGAVLGALVGAFSAISFDAQAGAAVGVTLGLIAWPVLSGIGLARSGIDVDALKARFWPSVTIETTKETIGWVRAQSPLGPRP